jgi:hypothetical protein
MLAYLAAHGEILERQYDGDRVLIHVRLPQRHLGPLHEKGTTFRAHQAADGDGGLLEPARLPAAIEDVA